MALPQRRGGGWARRHPRRFVAVAVLIHVALVALVVWLVSTSGTCPAGADSYAHLFEARSLLGATAAGSPLSAVEPLWYNGAQVSRFVGPVFGYVLAACEAVAGGVLGGYVAFCGLVYLVGALGWLLVGRRLGRPWLSVALGTLWFLLPANLTALFVEGDLPRCLCLALLPALLGLVDAFVERGGRKRLVGIGALSALMVLSSVGYAVLVGLGTLVYLMCACASRRSWARLFQVVLAMALGCGACGLWLVPYVMGGGLSDAVQVASQGLGRTLMSLGWAEGADAGLCLGLAAAAAIVFGLVCSRRDARPALLGAAVLVLLTAQVLQPVVGTLTRLSRAGSLGLLSVALACLLLALLRWKTLRTPVLVVVVGLLALDAAPTWQLVWGNHNGASANERLERHADETLVSEARDVTVQRLALVDESGLDAESAFLATSLDEPMAIAEGSDARTAVAANYEQLDRALEEGRFGYLFDRSVELGCDSVIIRTSLVQNWWDNVATRIDSAAGQSGYTLVDERGDYRLYHRDVDGTFGVSSTYDAIAIGSGAGQIALQFPSVEEADDACLDDYTADELGAYKVVYLDGFTYKSHDAAESLVRNIAARGARVVVMADGMPSDEHTGETSFLGVSAEPITFHNGFPELTTRVGALDCALFPSGHEQWQTVYVNGLDDVWGSVDEDGRSLPFFGSVCDGNVVFVGLNLTYFETVTGDAGVAGLLASALDLDPAALPQRTLVPLELEESAAGLTVTSPRDDVDTTLAWQDGFEDAQGATREAGLLHVGAGTTTLRARCPGVVTGAVVSALSAAVAAALLWCGRRKASATR